MNASAPIARCTDGPLHFSILKTLDRSAMHALYALTNQRETSLAMRVGTAVDHLVFEQGNILIFPCDRRQGPMWELWKCFILGATFAVYEGETRRGRQWDEFKRAHPDVPIFTRAEHDAAAESYARARGTGEARHPSDVITWSELAAAEPIARAVRESALGQKYLLGRYQVPLTFQMNGLVCATRGVDCVGAGFLSDLKVTNTTHPARFSWHARRMRWDCQLVFYQEGARQNGIDTSAGLYLVGVESTPPYPVTVLKLSERVIEQARRTLCLWLEQYRVCRESNAWPPYSQSVVLLDAEDELDLVGLEDVPAVEAGEL